MKFNVTLFAHWDYIGIVFGFISFVMVIFCCIFSTHFAFKIFRRLNLSTSNFISNSPMRSPAIVFGIVIPSPIFTTPFIYDLSARFCIAIFFCSCVLIYLPYFAFAIFRLKFSPLFTFTVSCCCNVVARFTSRIKTIFLSFVSVEVTDGFFSFARRADFSFHGFIIA